jgi:iron complex outermembrane recepter protein
MCRIIVLICTFAWISFGNAQQTSTITGSITDVSLNEPVIGAYVVLTKEHRTVTSIDGTYELKNVPYGTYSMVVFMATFDTLRIELVVDQPSIVQDGNLLGSTELEEVKITANLSTERNTPIAVTKISMQQITEELGSRDLPMILNATPGVYATQAGGGDGDARINIRGFDQRNIGVLIDGVPVNDMENGWVYWSNWFGLDAITSTIQVQRGLGATKLAIPSVGGTMNIVTQGIGSRKGLSFKQEYGTGNLLRTSLSYNTGLLKNGWGFTFSGSYKQSDGWVYGTPSQGQFVYTKVQKKYKKHLISLSAFMAPQHHGQRAYNQPIQFWDTAYASNLNVPIDTSVINNQGIRFNPHWGYITDENGERVMKNERLNYFNKPQVTLKDFWSISPKMSLSNIVYLSIGNGGGTKLSNSNIAYDEEGLVDWDAIILNNQVKKGFGGTLSPNVDLAYDPVLLKSNQVQISSVNKHFWVGYLSQLNYEINDALKLSGGLDYRFYKGEHYQEVYDLLGGDYFVFNGNPNYNSDNSMLKVGDKLALKPYNSHRTAHVNWGGAFGQIEYKKKRISSFLNISGVMNSYKAVDYFQKKTLSVGDTVLRIGINDTVSYNGTSYDYQSEGLEFMQTPWKSLLGGTIKTGIGFELNEYSTIFLNTGYLSRTPQFSNVIDNATNDFFKEIENEKVIAFEGGYTISTKRIAINLNGYYTNWKNKPFPNGVSLADPMDPTTQIKININGMDALHTGGEIDVAFKLNQFISFEGMFSYGDWTWQSSDTIVIPEYGLEFAFDAKGVHVGDAAQTGLSIATRISPIKNLYFKVQYQWFDRYYAQFNPFTLQGEKGRKESWKIPAYGLLNIYAGYRIKMKGYSLFTTGSITNLLNSSYISDATDSYYAPNNFDAQSASVMFGGGLRFNVSLGVQF